jgi:hypothetical protein
VPPTRTQAIAYPLGMSLAAAVWWSSEHVEVVVPRLVAFAFAAPMVAAADPLCATFGLTDRSLG